MFLAIFAIVLSLANSGNPIAPPHGGPFLKIISSPPTSGRWQAASKDQLWPTPSGMFVQQVARSYDNQAHFEEVRNSVLS